MNPVTGRHPTGLSLWLLPWFAGLYLRLTLLVAPSLGPDIARELDLSVAGMAALTRARHTASLAAGMFTVGYALTFILLQIGGMLVDNTGYEPLALAPLLIIAAVAVPTTGYMARAYRRRAL